METLSPIRLAPYFRTRPWGFHNLAPWFDFRTEGEPIGEVWLTGEMCLAETGQLRGRSLQEITKDYGSVLLGPHPADQDFPLLVKILFPKEKLSVQVHPDDALAQRYGEPRGKTECWYALDAQAGASVALGLRPGVTKEQVEKAVAAQTLESLLEMLPVQKGDMIFVDAGTVHAVGPGLVLLETQQTSDLTYRMYDYGSARELHLDKAFAAMRLTTRAGKVLPQNVDRHTVLIQERYFSIERWPAEPETARELAAPHSTVQMLFVLQGQIQIASAGVGSSFEPFALERNRLAVIPANSAPWQLTAETGTEVIRIFPNEP
jgi:mannose-6-phosphate isomerase